MLQDSLYKILNYKMRASSPLQLFLSKFVIKVTSIISASHFNCCCFYFAPKNGP